MWSRTATTTVTMAVSLCAAFAVAGCDGVASTTSGSEIGPSATPTTTGPAATPVGPFTLPASACDLLDKAMVEQVTGRTSVTLTPMGGTPLGQGRPVLTCALTDGALPVGLVTVDVRSAEANTTAGEELDGSVAGSLYKSSTTEPVSGLGDAARYGTAPKVGGLTYATVWTVTLGEGSVGDLSVTVASDDPDAARPGIVDLTRTALTRLGQPGASASPVATVTPTVNPETGP